MLYLQRLLLPLLCSAILAQPAEVSGTQTGCMPLGTSYIRTTLYFGLACPAGRISETQWRGFLEREVTPRFPTGLTVWEAKGQWRRPDGRIEKERAKVLLLVHEDTADIRGAIGAVIRAYKDSFQQESVLWETASVCAAF